MGDVKYTKQELRSQQIRLVQLQRYLPTLRLRKALLQAEVLGARAERDTLSDSRQQQYDRLTLSAPLISRIPTLHCDRTAVVEYIDRGSENIAGVEVPMCNAVTFASFEYDLYDTPPWLDRFIEEVRSYRTLDIKTAIAEERISILAKELRNVSIRVNLFEKILIPRCVKNIKAIKIFLDDLLLSAVSQAKIAKAKIVARKLLEEES
jgi:V/A-type H+-transporting ATPase subunit D